MNARSRIPRWIPTLATLVAVTPLGLSAQTPAERPERAQLQMTSPIERVLEMRDALELTPEQVRRLETFHSASTQRSAAARTRVEAAREEAQARMEATREEMRARPDSMRQRRQANPQAREARPAADPEVREAMETLRAEQVAAMTELRATLTVEQMSQFQRAGRDARPEARRRPGAGGRLGALAGSPAFRAGFGAGFMAARGPALQGRGGAAFRGMRAPGAQRLRTPGVPGMRAPGLRGNRPGMRPGPGGVPQG